RPSSVAIQTDGKIVVGGNNGNDGFAIVRYNPNGSLDTTFNGSGKVLTPVGSAPSVAIQTDGKIIAAGGTGPNWSAFTLVRYNADGSLDTSFNGTGIVSTSVGPMGAVSDLAIQTDGKIVVAGDSGPDECKSFVVVRYQGDSATPTSCPNPIDCNDFFVRQHYTDFLGREPDSDGLAFWMNEIASCGGDLQCIEI